jgi:hypothetical protein
VLATVSQVDPLYVDFSISEREMFELRRLADQKNLGRTVVGKVAVNMILEDGSLYPHEGKINFTDMRWTPAPARSGRASSWSWTPPEIRSRCPAFTPSNRRSDCRRHGSTRA